MELHHENVTWLLSNVQNGGNNVQISRIFGDELFHKENPTLKKLKLQRVAKLSTRFLLALTKNICQLFSCDLLL